MEKQSIKLLKNASRRELKGMSKILGLKINWFEPAESIREKINTFLLNTAKASIQLELSKLAQAKTVFVCDKKDVDSGQFPIENLKIFSLRNENIKIIIRDYAEIEHGEIELIQMIYH